MDTQTIETTRKKYDDRYVPTDYYGINKDTYVTYSYEPEYPSSYEPNHKPKHSSYDKDDPPPSSPPPSEEPGATIGNGPLGITFDSNFETIYVTNQADDTVDVIDTDTDEVIDTISVGDGPAGIAHDSDNERMYVTNIADNTLSVIDTATNEVIDTISVGDGPGGALGSSGPISILESLIRDDFIVWLDEQSQLHVTSTSP